MLGIGYHKWYEGASASPMRRHSSEQWERAVGGTRNSIRAIYGSSDNATVDHKNDPLCKIVDIDKLHTTTEPRRIDRGRTVVWDNVLTYTPPTAEEVKAEQEQHAQDLERLLHRAELKGMTLVEYCQYIGITLS